MGINGDFSHQLLKGEINGDTSILSRSSGLLNTATAILCTQHLYSLTVCDHAMLS